MKTHILHFLQTSLIEIIKFPIPVVLEILIPYSRISGTYRTNLPDCSAGVYLKTFTFRFVFAYAKISQIVTPVGGAVCREQRHEAHDLRRATLSHGHARRPGGFLPALIATKVATPATTLRGWQQLCVVGQKMDFSPPRFPHLLQYKNPSKLYIYIYIYIYIMRRMRNLSSKLNLTTVHGFWSHETSANGDASCL